MMKLKLLISLTLSAAFAMPSYSAPSSPAKSTSTSAQTQKDADILGDVSTIDQNEIAAATLAQDKATNTAVKKYAGWLYAQHTKNLQHTQNLAHKMDITPQDGPVAKKLQKQGKKELAKLKHANGVAFDKMYISAMIADHSAGLVLLNKLIKTASDPRLVRHLEMFRSHVKAHLEKARAIQKEMALS